MPPRVRLRRRAVDDGWMLVKVLMPSSLVFLWLLREYVKTRSLLRDEDDRE